MVCAIIHKEIVTGAMCSAVVVLKYHSVVNWKDTGGTIPVDRNTIRIPPRTTTQVCTSTGLSVPPISIGIQKIEGPRRSVIPQEVSNSEPLDSSINIIPEEHRDPTPSWSKVIGSKTFTNKIADVYARGRMKFGNDTVLSESPNFIYFGMLSVNTTYEIGYVFVPTNKIVSPVDGSNWLPSGHDISDATADRVGGKKAKSHYNFKS